MEDFRQIFKREITCYFLFQFQDGYTFFSKRKEFDHKGSKFFPFRAGLFSEGTQNIFERVNSAECVLSPINGN